MSFNSFNPPNRTLMGPGPSDVSPRVLAAMAKPTIGHLDPEFIRLMDEIKALLQYAFRTKNELTIPVSAPGSAGMETCFVNLVEPGDKVIVCQNGVFGGRMKENVERCGGIPLMVEDEWGKAIDPEKLQLVLKNNPDATIVAMVHAETSTGVSSDVEQLTRLAHAAGCLVIVDTVTSLGGSPLEVDKWQIDAVYSGTQKCISVAPGLSPISLNQKAIEKIKGRKSKVQSWFLDLNLVMGYWGSEQKRSYHHTAPVNALYGLHEGLSILKEEGIENAWARHERHHRALVAGLQAMGLQMLVDPSDRLPQLNSVVVPEGIDEAKIRMDLLQRFNLEIGAGLGALAGKVWRIGLMGHAANVKNIVLCLGALDSALSAAKVDIRSGVAVPAAMEALQ